MQYPFLVINIERDGRVESRVWDDPGSLTSYAEAAAHGMMEDATEEEALQVALSGGHSAYAIEDEDEYAAFMAREGLPEAAREAAMDFAIDMGWIDPPEDEEV